jgi:hypothetical protein
VVVKSPRPRRKRNEGRHSYLSERLIKKGNNV